MSSIQELEDRRCHVQELRRNYELSIDAFEQEYPRESRTPLQQARLDGLKADVADMRKEEQELKEKLHAEYRREERENLRDDTREFDRTR